MNHRHTFWRAVRFVAVLSLAMLPVLISTSAFQGRYAGIDFATIKIVPTEGMALLFMLFQVTVSTFGVGLYATHKMKAADARSGGESGR